MDAPKISVLIPLYNRKHYIAQAIDSALNQTFQDFEIIVRDDGSADGSADFVAQRYAAEISSGKLKLRRNEKNIGEFPTDNKLLREASGKYVMILHSDDLYLPQALEQMYTTAENFNADVVHAGSFLQPLTGDVISSQTQFKIMNWENRLVKNFEVVPNEPNLRFNEWVNGDTFIDAQYNIYKRKFILDNKIFFPSWVANLPFTLHWLMTAKIYVKTPDIFYIRRETPDSYSNDKRFLAKQLRRYILGSTELSAHFDKLLQCLDYFKNNPAKQYHAKAIFYNRVDNYELHRWKIYAQGITPEIQQAVESALKECFGDNVGYLTFMFHKIHCLPFEQDYNKINSVS